MSDRTLNPVSCAGCRRPLALAASVVGRLYCNEYCAHDFPVTTHEARDALVAEVVAKGLPKGEIAAAVNVTRQRIDQIASNRLQVTAA